MRSTRTLSSYVMREAVVYCALAFFVLTLILLTQNLLRRLDELFLVGMTLHDLGVVLRCLFPVVLSYSIPLAFLLGIMLSIRRFGADGELAGLRAAGISPAMLLVPHLVLGLVASALSAWLLVAVEHESRRELVQLFKTVAARGAILEPGKFRHIGRRLVFVEERERDGSLRGVMIVDRTRRERPFRIFAQQGHYRFDEEQARILLELEDGGVHMNPSRADPRRYERIHFETFSYDMDVGHILGGNFGPVRPKQMNRSELLAVLSRAEAGDDLRDLDQRDPLEYELEIHRRWALPFAPLLFAGVGIPIALASEQRGRNLGLLFVLAAAFAYYAVAAVAESMAHQGLFDAATASWLPNLLFAVAGIVLALREQKRIPA